MSDPVKLSISEECLGQVLRALLGPPHHIRELQMTMNLPGEPNSLTKLVNEYNAEVTRINDERKKNKGGG